LFHRASEGKENARSVVTLALKALEPTLCTTVYHNTLLCRLSSLLLKLLYDRLQSRDRQDVCVLHAAVMP
jgi:hypothetical protein